MFFFQNHFPQEGSSNLNRRLAPAQQLDGSLPAATGIFYGTFNPPPSINRHRLTKTRRRGLEGARHCTWPVPTLSVRPSQTLAWLSGAEPSHRVLVRKPLVATCSEAGRAIQFHLCEILKTLSVYFEIAHIRCPTKEHATDRVNARSNLE